MPPVPFSARTGTARKPRSRFPAADGSSGNAGKRAIEVVRLCFAVMGAKCVAVIRGHDIEVVFRDSPVVYKAEVKGTRDDKVAFGKLKVSSQESHRLLAEEGIPLLRVANVFSPTPVIHESFHGEDFTLVEEPRWRVMPVAKIASKPTSQPTPLRRRLLKQG